jgi:class 3 adenylate cyclase/CHASE2 domain-containing sensor protein
MKTPARPRFTLAERARLRQTAGIGLSIIALVLLAEALGLLNAIDSFLYDERARHFRCFAPPPTDRLVHLDIDDATLRTVGSWPWPRSDLALILDEVHAAGADALAIDAIFIEPQRPRISVNADGSPGPIVDDDAEFAAAVRRFGKVLMPLSITPARAKQHSPGYLALRDLFAKNLETTLDQAHDEMKRIAYPPPGVRFDFENAYLAARREVLGERIEKAWAAPPPSLPELQARLLPGRSAKLDSPLLRTLAEEYDRIRARRILDRHTIAPIRLDPPLLLAEDDEPPILPLASAAGATGFVNYTASSDGVVRHVPLLMQNGDRVYPQMALSLACLSLGVRPSDLIIKPDRILLPRPGQTQITIPVYASAITQRPGLFAMFIDVPWSGPPDDWTVMYDYPRYRDSKNHLSVAAVWDAIQTRRRVLRNNDIADDALLYIYSQTDPAAAEDYQKNRPPMDDTAARKKVIEAVLADAFVQQSVQAVQEAQKQGEPVKEADLRLVEKVEDLRLILKSNAQLVADAARQRRRLTEQFSGKAVLLGWTATAAAQTDMVTTSIHADCPGVVIHGTIFSGIMTGDLWRVAPRWAGPVMTVLLGLLALAAVALCGPMVANLIVLALGLAFVAFDGLLLFDYGNVTLPAAGPLAALIATWSGCTAWRYVVERWERARVTRRFRSYVDPVLVDYVLEHPHRNVLAGEMRELTVVFTDLAGFTTISEKLKEKTVPLLNDYMGLMVPIIRGDRGRRRGGYVNKFLGDGIMFFYGAPRPDHHHPIHAVETVIDMQKALIGFNKALVEQGLPQVKMRAGVVTGSMVVGDAGSVTSSSDEDIASDYTVLGDNVNLAARLESANKYTGTLIMLSDRTVELLKGRFLVRPIGKLQVVGKTEGVVTYEPLAYAEEATPQQHRLAEMTRAMFDRYQAGDFPGCLAAAAAIDAAYDPSKLTALYLHTCEKFIAAPPETFNGEIVLTEK